jgi:hypothetical protein
VLGVIAPVVVFNVKPTGVELNVPVVYAPVPVKFTDCDVASLEQNGVS